MKNGCRLWTTSISHSDVVDAMSMDICSETALLVKQITKGNLVQGRRRKAFRKWQVKKKGEKGGQSNNTMRHRRSVRKSFKCWKRMKKSREKTISGGRS